MKVLVTGSNGLLGQKLVDSLASDPQVNLIATARGANRNPDGNYVYQSMDVTDQEDIEKAFEYHRPDAVIHTAAMTQVDQCETDKELCWDLNVNSVKYLIDACRKYDTFLLHLSTDFVFDGENGPYKEDDEPNPISYYAESKLASEKLLQESDIQWAVARTMLVYGVAHDMSRSNIILWVKKSLEEKKKIKVVNDQWRMPTLAEDLAEGCILIVKGKHPGIFHISGSDMLTPYAIAVATARYFKLDQNLIEEVDGSVFTQAAKRPPKTGFILDKARTVLGYEPVSFQEGLRVLDQELSFLK